MTRQRWLRHLRSIFGQRGYDQTKIASIWDLYPYIYMDSGGMTRLEVAVAFTWTVGV